jgi:16S rRNA (cytidine1402-2'-O)-methyltransferase
MANGTLYVIGTPLGNLGDLSARAAEVLRGVGVVAAEDTRRTRQLLSSLDAHPARLLSYHAHSEPGREQALLALLAEGEDVALVSDAGTPGVSDPGVSLVAAAHRAGATVVPIPGPSAVAVALSAAGLPADRFLFLGFVPRKGRERRERLAEVSASPHTVVLLEAANRLLRLLEDLTLLLGAEHPAVVARELTKLHEEVRAGGLGELVAHYTATPPRGEVTLVVGGSAVPSAEAAVDQVEVAAAVRGWLDGGESRRAAVRRVSSEFGLSRNDAYRLVMDLE